MVTTFMRNAPKRDQLDRLVKNTIKEEVWARIRAMSIDDKYAELREYFRMCGIMNFDVDATKLDQHMLKVPDSAIDHAVAICWALTMRTWSLVEPKSAAEMRDYIPSSEFAKNTLERWAATRGIRAGPPARESFRKGGRAKLDGKVMEGDFDDPYSDEQKKSGDV